MPGNIIQYAFVSGEIAPALLGRSDLEKYDLGLALARNWRIDYRGGMSTRPGLEFIDYIQNDDQEIRHFKFEFSPDIANTYLVLMGLNYFRFVQDGAYVVESDVTVTGATQSNPCVITAAGHGFMNGDWIQTSGFVGGMTELNGRTLEVANKTANTFELIDAFGNGVDSFGYAAYSSGGVVNRIYTVAHSYLPADFAKIKVDQIRDTIRLTHPDYRIRNLVRVDHTNWTLDFESFGSEMAVPTALAHSVSGAGTSGAIFAVTAVNAAGDESPVSDYHFVDDVVNYTTTAGWVTLTWTASSDAVYYNVYRSIVMNDEAQLTAGMQLGFLGQSFGTQFTDNNIIPDFTRTPPVQQNPFADSQITSIEITAQGSLYAKDDTISLSGGGTGFRGFPVVDDAGKILSVIILNPGRGYSSPAVTFNTSTGSGATATATVGPATGNNPSVSQTFQQRQLYAATVNSPLDIWASKVGLLSNMDVSRNVTDSDAWNFTIDSHTVSPIRHMLDMQGGLLVFAHTNIWRLRGGNTESEAVTATSALAEPQSFLGISELQPINLDTDILYVQAKDSTVRLLSFNDFSKLYSGQDVSILSSHFFKADNKLIDWDYSAAPDRIVYAVREDGVLLSFTVVREQNVEGWTWNTTDGRFKCVTSVEENGLDRVYVVVEREVDGTTRKFLERIAPRDFDTVEDAWCVDSGLQLGSTAPAGTLTAAAATGDGVEFTVSGATPFVSGDVGKIIRAGGGKAEIVTFNSSSSVDCDIKSEIVDINYETGLPWPQVTGDWTMDAKVTTISGLWHLEGKTVSILGDGNVFVPQVVVDGSITLPTGVTRAIVGLPYACYAQTLPPTASDVVIEGRRKLIIGVAIRLADTRGLKTGQSLDKLFDIKERTTEQYGEPIRLKNSMQYEIAAAAWDLNGQTYLVQDQPLPATVLGIVTELDVGDDTD